MADYMNNTNYITIKHGEEYSSRIETNFNNEDTLRPIYEHALKIIADIVKELEAEKNFDEEDISWSGRNVITFCGGRGQGKTSTMLSVVDYLKKKPSERKGFSEKIYEHLNNQLFMALKPIDPATLNGSYSILNMVISKIFIEISGNMSLVSSDEAQFHRKNLMMLCKKCYRNIRYLEKGSNTEIEDEDLDALARLGNISVLKKDMYELIDCYLSLCSNRENKYKYLLIIIDDADMSAANVYEICECIRLYLSIPNVIIMIAMDCLQLKMAIYQKYLTLYKNVCKLQEEYKIEEFN